MKFYTYLVALIAVITIPTYINLYADENLFKDITLNIDGGFCKPDIYCGATIHLNTVSRVTVYFSDGDEVVMVFNKPYQAQIFGSSQNQSPIIQHTELGITDGMLRKMKTIKINGTIKQK